VGIPVSLVLMTAFLVSAVSGSQANNRVPPTRQLPAAVRETIIVVPIGDVPSEQLATLPREYASEYGLSLTVADPIPLAESAFDPARSQFVAQGLIDAMAAAHPELSGGEQVVIGVTRADIYIRDIDWQWAFGLREGGRLAIVSTARMRLPLRPEYEWSLMRRMLTRDIGFLCYGLPPTDDPRDLLYRDVLGLDDLLRMSDHL
jgi:predicted Zn-dependent protease